MSLHQSVQTVGNCPQKKKLHSHLSVSRRLAKQTVVQGKVFPRQRENTSAMSTGALSHQLAQVRANSFSTVWLCGIPFWPSARPSLSSNRRGGQTHVQGLLSPFLNNQFVPTQAWESLFRLLSQLETYVSWEKSIFVPHNKIFSCNTDLKQIQWSFSTSVGGIQRSSSMMDG